MSVDLWIEPQDVLYLRGNRLFGAAGDDAMAQMPPWPSLVAGAIRSRMLVDHGVNVVAFAKGGASLSPALATALGTVAEPGSFEVSQFSMAQRDALGAQQWLFPLPADMVVFDADHGAIAMQPTKPEGVIHEQRTPMLPLLRIDKAAKAESGYWLNQQGMEAWLRGDAIVRDHLCKSDRLWKSDARLGIALDAERRVADEGRIYTTDAVAMTEGSGFLVRIDGVAAELLPKNGLLRLGGDGRAAVVKQCDAPWPEADSARIQQERRFRLLLTTPGYFAEGWQLPGMEADGRWHCDAGSARLCAASVARSEVISGWDIAAHIPKPAVCTAPVGTVYWLDDWQGDVSALQECLAQGLACVDKTRKVEGFNRCVIAPWNKESGNV